MSHQKTSFVLRSKKTGKRVCYREYPVRDDAYAPPRVELFFEEPSGTDDVYEQPTALELAKILQRGTIWMDGYDYPDFSDIEKAELEICEQVVTISLTPVVVDVPPVLKEVYSSRKPRSLILRYAGVDVPEIADTLVVFELPAGETLESMKRFENQTVETSWKHYHVFQVVAPPEDYEALPGQAARVAVIAMDDFEYKKLQAAA